MEITKKSFTNHHISGGLQELFVLPGDELQTTQVFTNKPQTSHLTHVQVEAQPYQDTVGTTRTLYS